MEDAPPTFLPARRSQQITGFPVPRMLPSTAVFPSTFPRRMNSSSRSWVDHMISRPNRSLRIAGFPLRGMAPMAVFPSTSPRRTSSSGHPPTFRLDRMLSLPWTSPILLPMSLSQDIPRQTLRPRPHRCQGAGVRDTPSTPVSMRIHPHHACETWNTPRPSVPRPRPRSRSHDYASAPPSTRPPPGGCAPAHFQVASNHSRVHVPFLSDPSVSVLP